MRMSRVGPVLFAVIFGLAASAQVFSASASSETARQLAAETEDKPATLKGRQDALSNLTEAVKLFLNAGENEEAARTLNRVGRLQLLLSAPNDALSSHGQALALLKPTASPEIKVDSLNGLAAAYMLLQNRRPANNALRRSVALSEQSSYISGQAQALLTLSDCQNYDNHVLALRTAQSALTLWETLNDKSGMARTHGQIGRCYMAQNLLSDASQNFETEAQLCRESNDFAEQAEALFMLGFVEQRKGEWITSVSLLTQAQALLDEEAEPDRMGGIAIGWAWAFHENGLPEVGLTHYQQALAYFRRAQDIHMIWYTTWAIGRTHYLLKDYSVAVNYLQQALDGVAPDSIEAAPCYQYLAMVYLSKEQYDIALQKLKLALDIYTRTINPMELAEVRELLGQVSERQGQFEQARLYYKQALATFTKLSDRLNQAAIYYALGQLEFKSQRYDLAEDYLRESIEVTDNIRRASASSDLAAAFSAAVYERYEKYIDCLMHQDEARPARGLMVRAFETSEVARGRSLAELLRATETIPGIDPQLAAQEKALRQSLRAKEDYKITLLSKAYRKEELEASEVELARLEEEYKQLGETIRTRYPSYEQINRPASWDLQRIQEQVIADDETMLLEYSLGSDQSYVWAVTRESIKSFNLPSRALITDAAQKVHKLLGAPPGPDIEEQLTPAVQELSRMILSPVAAELSKRRIIVVADGALHYIPFQIFPTPSADGEPLVANHEIINAPSASILGELRKEATVRRPTKVLAAFGDPVFASNYAQRNDASGSEQSAAVQAMEVAPLQSALRDIELNGDSFDPSVIKPLFYAKRELTNLRDAATSGQTFVASGFAATRAQLLSMDLTQYAILHLATHGLLDPKRPENSGLVLSTIDRDRRPLNGFVCLQDIYGLHAPVDLVVLSACQTALGKDVRGEGLLGLTRGFMYAGASSVVASLWKVDDEATGELMRQFYTNMLAKGMTPAAGLRAAQNSIRERPEWRAPYYWAGFTLQGEYRQVIKPSFATGGSVVYRKVIISVTLMLLGLAALFYFYRRLRTRQQSR